MHRNGAAAGARRAQGTHQADASLQYTPHTEVGPGEHGGRQARPER